MMPSPATQRGAALRESAPVPIRVGAAIFAAACLALLITAASITPNARGMGTHTQLGLPHCGWVVMFGRPCMTCGMTTAFAHVVRLELIAAFRAQPLGALLALLTPVALFASLHASILGARIDIMVAPLLRPRSLWVIAGLFLAAWGYKMMVS